MRKRLQHFVRASALTRKFAKVRQPVVSFEQRKDKAGESCSGIHPIALFGFYERTQLYSSHSGQYSNIQNHKSYKFITGISAKPKQMDLPIIPRPEPPYISIQVGEDAFFSRCDSMGIADGVGGWAGVKGSNAALYSLKMMHYAGIQLEHYDDISGEYDNDLIDYEIVTPADILAKSYLQVNADARKENIIGSTTALIVMLRKNELRIANLGDCGIMVIRGGEPIFRSEEQQHAFNFPYQLGPVSKDSPKDTQSFVVKIQTGDIVVLGSDGLFDNVFDEEIIDIVVSKEKNKLELTNPQEIADALLCKARDVAENSRFTSSPFQQRAIHEGFYYQGGKVDDMTILVSVIREDEDSPDRR